MEDNMTNCKLDWILEWIEPFHTHQAKRFATEEEARSFIARHATMTNGEPYWYYWELKHREKEIDAEQLKMY